MWIRPAGRESWEASVYGTERTSGAPRGPQRRTALGLRRKGKPIPANDMWIAASAREHGLMVLTRDAHFRDIDGLLVASSVEMLLP